MRKHLIITVVSFITFFYWAGNVFAADVGTYMVSSNFHPYINWSIVTAEDIKSTYVDKHNNNIIYTTKNGIFLIDKNGNRKWSFSKPNLTEFNVIVSTSGTIYVGAKEVKFVSNGYDVLGTNLYAFSQKGELKWERNLKSINSSSLVIDKNETIYITSNSNLYVFDKDGNDKWVFTQEGITISFKIPNIDNEGTIFIGTDSGKLFVIYPNGILKTIINLGDYQNVSILGTTNNGDLVVNGVSKASIHYIFEVSKEGEIKWKDWFYENRLGASLIDGDLKYIRHSYYNRNYDMVSCYLNSNEPIWERILPFNTTSGPVINTKGIILIGSSTENRKNIDLLYKYLDGYTIHILNKDGELIQHIKIGDETKIFVREFLNDNTFIAHSARTIYSINLGVAPEQPILNEVSDKDTIVTGKAEQSLTINVKVGTSVLGTSTVSTDGIFTVTIPKQKAGTKLNVTAIDDSGNSSKATEVTVKDTEKPIINGVVNKTIKVGEVFDALDGVTVTDNLDGDITSKIIVTGNVDNKKLGKYLLTYKITDNSGNTTSVIRKITVIDNVKPTISGATNKAININTQFNPKTGVTAKDNVDGDLTRAINITGTVNIRKKGTYKLIYTVSDKSRNVTTVTRKITIFDNIKPIISGAKNKTIKLKTKFNPKTGVSAKDNLDGNLTDKIKVTGSVNTKKKGKYKIIYTVSDKSGNKTVVTRIIIVK